MVATHRRHDEETPDAASYRSTHGRGRKAYRPLDGRHAEQVTVACRVRYTGEVPTQPHCGEGLTKDISLSDCTIVSERPVTRGTLLTLAISLPDGALPLMLPSAHVLRVSGCQFSVRFRHLAPEHRKRLHPFIWWSISHDTVCDRRTRFRLA